jgi:hypothetical protein
MYVRDVEPHWSTAKIDFTCECSECGAEIKKVLTKPHDTNPSLVVIIGHDRRIE